MHMKKLLWVVLILVLLMLGGGIWFWQKYGTFVKMYLKMKPDESFDLAHAPPAPDYSLETHWATLPTTRDAADLIPTGFGGRDAQAGAVGIAKKRTLIAQKFYIFLRSHLV